MLKKSKVINGGLFWLPFILGAGLGALMSQDLDYLADSFLEGYNDGSK